MYIFGQRDYYDSMIKYGLHLRHVEGRDLRIGHRGGHDLFECVGMSATDVTAAWRQLQNTARESASSAVTSISSTGPRTSSSTSKCTTDAKDRKLSSLSNQSLSLKASHELSGNGMRRTVDAKTGSTRMSKNREEGVSRNSSIDPVPANHSAGVASTQARDGRESVSSDESKACAAPRPINAQVSGDTSVLNTSRSTGAKT